MFNPLDYLHRASDRIDLGPDCSFLKENSSSCDYFFEGQLNELLVTKDDLDLSILRLNARSLYGNFGKFNPFAPEPPVTARALSDVISFNGQGQLCTLTCVG